MLLALVSAADSRAVVRPVRFAVAGVSPRCRSLLLPHLGGELYAPELSFIVVCIHAPILFEVGVHHRIHATLYCLRCTAL